MPSTVQSCILAYSIKYHKRNAQIIKCYNSGGYIAFIITVVIKGYRSMAISRNEISLSLSLTHTHTHTHTNNNNKFHVISI